MHSLLELGSIKSSLRSVSEAIQFFATVSDWFVARDPRNDRLFRCFAPAAGHHALKPALDDGFGIPYDARHQFGASRDVVDQSLHLARRPDAFVGIAGGVYHLAACAGHEIA